MRFPIIPTALVACLTLGLAPTLSLADTADAAGSAAAADSSNEGNDAAADAVPTGGLQVFGGLGLGANFNPDGKGSGTQTDVNGYVEAEVNHVYFGAYGDLYNTKLINEIDLYFGYRSETAGGLSYDVNYYRYFYPNDGGNCCGELGLSLGQSLNDKLSASLDLAYDPEAALANAHLGLQYGLTDKVSVEGKVGVSQNDGAALTKEWELGVSYALSDTTAVQLTYNDGNDYPGYFGLTMNFDTTLFSR